MHTRDQYWDSVKGLLIIFVILGHFSKKELDVPSMAGLTTFIYAFHMSAFSFVSGLFSRNITQQRAKDVTAVLIPYMIFQVLYTAFVSKSLNPKIFNPLHPTDHLWYLLSLFIWRSVIPYFQFMRFPVATAVSISVVAGAFDLGPGFNLTLGFLPFFVAGYFPYTKGLSYLRACKSYYARMILIVTLAVCIAGGTYYFFERGCVFYFFWKPYSFFETFKFLGPIFRLSMIAVSSAMVAVFLASVRESPFLARIGEASIYPYILHNFLVVVWTNKVSYVSFLSPILFIVGSVFIAVFFTSPRVTRVLHPVVFPSTKWIIRGKLSHAADG